MKDNYCVIMGAGSEVVSGLSAGKVILNSFLIFSGQIGHCYK